MCSRKPGSNTQGVRWIIVRNPEQRALLAKLNKQAVDEYVANRRASSLPHHPSDKRKRMLESVRWQSAHMAEIPALIIACHEWIETPNNEERQIGAGGSIWPAVQNLLLAARALGLGAVPTTLGLTNRPAIREILAVPDTVEPHVLIPVGYPLGNFGAVTRLPVHETVHYDRW